MTIGRSSFAGDEGGDEELREEERSCGSWHVGVRGQGSLGRNIPTTFVNHGRSKLSGPSCSIGGHMTPLFHYIRIGGSFSDRNNIRIVE